MQLQGGNCQGGKLWLWEFLLSNSLLKTFVLRQLIEDKALFCEVIFIQGNSLTGFCLYLELLTRKISSSEKKSLQLVLNSQRQRKPIRGGQSHLLLDDVSSNKIMTCLRGGCGKNGKFVVNWWFHCKVAKVGRKVILKQAKNWSK